MEILGMLHYSVIIYFMLNSKNKGRPQEHIKKKSTKPRSFGHNEKIGSETNKDMPDNDNHNYFRGQFYSPLHCIWFCYIG